jgi:hypothetical protein
VIIHRPSKVVAGAPMLTAARTGRNVSRGGRLAAALEDLHDDGRVVPGMRMLLDLRAAVLLHTYIGLIQIGVRFRRHHHRWLQRTALLVEGDLAYGVAR